MAALTSACKESDVPNGKSESNEFKIINESEPFGTEGKAYSKPKYKVELRWEPNSYIIPANTYRGCFDGIQGAGFEIGVDILTPQFLNKDFILGSHMQS
ncbi:hypothetical protein [Algoriphagus marinus]|uniref:hypothetical protein n=1 Tax=Algoriphagus marinus TaxID=1925762 RepID=UPI00094BB1D4|nr:hypothetical protein [Algoriphagus marinus]